ncbi:hypothetical protein BCF46_2752 [Litoreibacter meonggei]|uniref:Uncharacterized protein n=2 Tax=Litoreibacter meonggei TaxID=1049199 RepID=A0A497VEM5_9RHOB|nr:hypothetical protein BCF46_2752 [Litoreibacter meonggei]
MDRLGPTGSEIICQTDVGWKLDLGADMHKSSILQDGSLFQLLSYRNPARATGLDNKLGVHLTSVAPDVWEVSLSVDGELREKSERMHFFVWARDPFDLPLKLSQFNETDVRFFRCHSYSDKIKGCGTYYNVPLCNGYKSPAWNRFSGLVRVPEPGLGADIRAEKTFLEILSTFKEINDHAESAMAELFEYSCKK